MNTYLRVRKLSREVIINYSGISCVKSSCVVGRPLVVHVTYVKAARLLINQIVTGGASKQHLIIFLELAVMKLMTTTTTVLLIK
jgi:hypothetical protein